MAVWDENQREMAALAAYTRRQDELLREAEVWAVIGDNDKARETMALRERLSASFYNTKTEG